MTLRLSDIICVSALEGGHHSLHEVSVIKALGWGRHMQVGKNAIFAGWDKQINCIMYGCIHALQAFAKIVMTCTMARAWAGPGALLLGLLWRSSIRSPVLKSAWQNYNVHASNFLYAPINVANFAGAPIDLSQFQAQQPDIVLSHANGASLLCCHPGLYQ